MSGKLQPADAFAGEPHSEGPRPSNMRRHSDARGEQMSAIKSRSWPPASGQTDGGRGHPEATGYPESTDSPGPGSAAATKEPGARGGPEIRRVNRNGRWPSTTRRPKLQRQPQQGRRRAMRHCRTARIMVNAGNILIGELDERSRACRNNIARHHGRRIQAPQTVAASSRQADARAYEPTVRQAHKVSPATRITTALPPSPPWRP